MCFRSPYISIEEILYSNLIKNSVLFIEKLHNIYMQKRHFRCLNNVKAIDLSKDKMKRRAFHLRSLIDNIKSKKARQEVIKEYVNLISQMSRNN